LSQGALLVEPVRHMFLHELLWASAPRREVHRSTGRAAAEERKRFSRSIFKLQLRVVGQSAVRAPREP
jgi:hypothetical protein